MLTKATTGFLKQLEENNNRERFERHRKEGVAAQREFETFVTALIENIGRFDKPIANLAAKSSIFRIYRDTRFSKSKLPYKTNFGAHLNGLTKHTEIHEAAGYYVHIELRGRSFLWGGAYMPSPEWLAKIRARIAGNPQMFLDIVENPSFTKYFTFEGERLKRAPHGYDEEHPAIHLLKYKSFLAMHPFTDSEILSKDFLEHATEVFKALKPFDDYLNGK